MAFYFLIKLLQWGNLNISNAGVANDGFCGCITYRGRFNCALNTNRKEYAFYYFSFPAAHALWPRQRFIVSGSCQISGGKSLMVLHLFATRHLLLFGTWEGGGGGRRSRVRRRERLIIHAYCVWAGKAFAKSFSISLSTTASRFSPCSFSRFTFDAPVYRLSRGYCCCCCCCLMANQFACTDACSVSPRCARRLRNA